jgi:hypothetical protein
MKVVILLDRFWKAVRAAYPDAWQNRTSFILLQSIGITAFSRLGADVILDLAYTKKAVSQADFDLVLSTIANKVNLSRDAFPGLAGLAGAKVVYQRLLAANAEDEVALNAVKLQLDLDLPKAPSVLDS